MIHNSFKTNALQLVPFLNSLLYLIFVFTATSLAQNSGHPSPGSIDFETGNPPIELDYNRTEPFKNVFVKVAEKVVSSIVSVVPTRIDTVLFYRNPYYRDPFDNEPQQQERRTQGLGSGVIVSKNGYILTNFHVVTGAEEIEIRLSDDRAFPAEIAGSDSLSDVAVIRITGTIPSDLPVAYLGNSDSLKVGDWVAAIGNPFNLTSTMTSGIVSALGRRVEAELAYQNFIQTDAAINPGNSGGALVTIQGAVVGINTLIFSETGGFMGIGFAIPINMARKVMEDLIYEGRVIRGYVGVSVQEITPQIGQAMNLETTQGAFVSDVPKGQPAQKSGIMVGDVIISIDGQTVQNANDLTNIIASLQPGKEVWITIIRDGRKVTLTLKPIDRSTALTEEEPVRQQPRPQRGNVNNTTGIGVEELTPEIKSTLNLPDDLKGVVVVSVAPEVTDNRATLRHGDIIVRAKKQGQDWKTITSVDEYLDFARQIKAGQAVILQVQRQNRTIIVPFEVR